MGVLARTKVMDVLRRFANYARDAAAPHYSAPPLLLLSPTPLIVVLALWAVNYSARCDGVVITL